MADNKSENENKRMLFTEETNVLLKVVNGLIV